MNERLWLMTLAALGGITALSIDIYLPGLPQIAAEMGTSMNKVQWTLSGFVMAFAFGQLFYGPISDRFGRRVPLLFGLLLYVLGTVLCWLATSIEALVIARLIQGLGASSGAISCLAIARDRFEGPEMTRVLALTGAVVGLAPILAPLMGGLLQSWFTWRASFLFLTVFSCLLWVWVFFMLPETKTGGAQPLQSSLGKYKLLITHAEFVVFASLNTFSFLAIFAFLTLGGPIMMGTLGVSSATFAVMFASNASMFLIGNLVTARLTRTWATPQMVVLGVALMCFGALLMLSFAWTVSAWALIVPMHLVTFGAAIVMTMGNAGIVAPFRSIAGSASALAGFLRFAISGLLAAVLASYPQVSISHLAWAILLCGVVCAAASVRLYWQSRRGAGEIVAQVFDLCADD